MALRSVTKRIPKKSRYIRLTAPKGSKVSVEFKQKKYS